MQEKSSGQFYAPKGKPSPVCRPGECQVGIIGLDHGHIYGMCNGLTEAGATLVKVCDQDPQKVAQFSTRFPEAAEASSVEEILEDANITLVASAIIPNERAALGLRTLAAGKHYFSDKPPFTTQAQVDAARAAVAASKTRTQPEGLLWAVYYSERLHVEASVYAQRLIEDGAIGKVVHISGWGPHRISIPTRPAWFFDPAYYGGILVDLGSHQIEQMLFFTGARDATISASHIANYRFPQYSRFEDFGDASLVMNNGATGYFSVNWLTPDGLGAWGDGRTFIQGTNGYLELRKYIDVAADPEGDHVILVNHEGEYHFRAAGTCGFPFFGALVRDCLDGTRTALDQEMVFRSAELSIEAQQAACRIVIHAD
ncbi:MAG: Gfo/Idh/MocA family oxidoreductase [Rectinema sp.]|nr:Gfo/Idh/MocA family oxidoreductase [Rectinema sp.]